MDFRSFWKSIYIIWGSRELAILVLCCYYGFGNWHIFCGRLGLRALKSLYYKVRIKTFCIVTLYYIMLFPKPFGIFRVFRNLRPKAQPRGRFGRKSLPNLAHFSLFWADGEVKVYRTYRETNNLDQNFSQNPCLRALGWDLQVNICSPEWNSQIPFALANIPSMLK